MYEEPIAPNKSPFTIVVKSIGWNIKFKINIITINKPDKNFSPEG